MNMKTRIELIFLGIVIMAVISAILSIMVAMQQMIVNGEFNDPITPASQVSMLDENGGIGTNLVPLVPSETMVNYYSTQGRAKFEKARRLLANAEGVQDTIQAHDLLSAAVRSNFPERAEAAYELAKLYRLAPSDECQTAAFEWFKKSAEWNYRKAHLELAKSYQRGLGVNQNYDLAINHYRIAGEQGSAAGALELIELYSNGMEGTEPNKVLAKATLKEFMPLLETSARSGNGRAARSIARIYMAGDLVEKDMQIAQQWFENAVSSGDAAAMHDLAFIKLDENGQNSDPKRIIELLRNSASLGYSGAMTALGRLHLKEQFGLEKEQSIEWFSKGAASGHPGAMEEVARLYFDGDLVGRDLEKARDFATRGMQLKHEGATALLEEIDAKTAQ